MKIQRSYLDEYQYQLYELSKKKKPFWGNLTLFIYGAIVLAVAIVNYHSSGDKLQIAVFLGAISLYLAGSIFFRNYFRNRRLLNELKKAYDKTEGTFIELSAEGNDIVIREEGRMTRLAPANFKDLTEVEDYYFLRLADGGAYIISRMFSQGTDAFADSVRALGIPVRKDSWRPAK